MGSLIYQGNRLPSEHLANFNDLLKIATSPVVKTRPYTAQIKRAAPSAFVFLLDQSGSMSSTVSTATKQSMSKAEFVAEAVNKILLDTVSVSERGNDYYNYIDICVIGYGGDSDSTAKYAWEADLAGKDFVTITDLTQNLGGVSIEDKKWISPVARSLTPMKQALALAHDTLVTWLAKYVGKDIFPPIVINITDGEATDGKSEDLIKAAQKIKNLKTTDGNVLLFNVHISDVSNQEVLFPCAQSELPNDPNAHLLFDMSSDLPDIFDANIANMLKKDKNGAYSAMAFNANIESIVNFLNIGTTPSRERIK